MSTQVGLLRTVGRLAVQEVEEPVAIRELPEREVLQLPQDRRRFTLSATNVGALHPFTVDASRLVTHHISITIVCATCKWLGSH